MKFDFHVFNNKNFNPTRFVVIGFATIILLGTLLLHLPMASRDGGWTPLLDCLFTATSATCVTGLVVVDTYLHWTVFGQAVILILLQLGGLGFVTLFSLVSLALNQRIGLSQRLALATALNLTGTAGVVRMVRHALRGTFLVEGIGALILSTRFIPIFGWGKGLWFGLFHSVSAFCNGGFDLLGEYSGEFSSLAGFQRDPVVLFTIMALIVVGGLGFFVWEDVLQNRCWKKLSLYSKMVLAITAALILFGTGFFLAVEWSNSGTYGNMPVWEKTLNAMFQSVTLRTAGYSTIDQSKLLDSSAVMSIVLMLIGGSSGSTAGGLKTVTVGVLLLALRDGLRGRNEVVFRGRTIPDRRVMDAMTLTLVIVLMFLTGSMAVSLIDGIPFLPAAYEVGSAMATVGLSMGVTPTLSPVCTLCIISCMYLGRVGILSFSVAFLVRRQGSSKVRYPAVDVMIG